MYLMYIMGEIYVGHHVTYKNKIINALTKTVERGANSVQIFVGNPRAYSAKLTSQLKQAPEVKKYIIANKLRVYIHAPYAINLAADNDCEHNLSVLSLIEQLKVGSALGAQGVIVHVGKYLALSKEDATENMLQCTNYILTYIKQHRLHIDLILETAAGQGTELLTDKKEFYNFCAKIKSKYFKVCVDTAHIWAAGEDPATYLKSVPKNTISVVHLNNSKVAKNSRLDRHEHVKDGKISVDVLEAVVKYCKTHKITMIMEVMSNEDEEIEWIKNVLF